MGRIERKFEELKSSGRKGFIPFVTAGDPSFETSISILKALANAGADVIELLANLYPTRQLSALKDRQSL